MTGHTIIRRAQTALAAVACGASLAMGAARADEIYTFNTTSYSATPGTIPAQGFPLTATFDLTDTQVASGAFSLQGNGTGGTEPNGTPLYGFTGDVGGFSNIAIQGDRITPTSIFGAIDASFTFDTAGDVTSSNLRYLGFSVAAQVSGTGNAASGYVGSDNGTCALGFAPAQPTTAPGQCSVSGFWSASNAANAVPEPASFAMLGVGLIGALALRRRSAA